MASGLGIEPGPHWWEASALTTAQILLPLAVCRRNVTFLIARNYIVKQIYVITIVLNPNLFTTMSKTLFWFGQARRHWRSHCVKRLRTNERMVNNKFDSVPQGLCSPVVYNFSCAGCNASYIGETTRHLCTRSREHLLSSHVYRHL